jgi:FkbM family methyltransferase
MRIYYGIIDNNIDVTNICREQLTHNNIIIIPQGDTNRARYFTDPLNGVHKKVFIETNGAISEHDEYKQIKINIRTNEIEPINDDKLTNIHSKLKINYGTLNDELPEQKMVVRYLTGNEKVLEIGGNIGRNSLVIASIVNNLVTLECDPNIANQLRENRDLNRFNFHIECSALSNRKLIQNGWDTIPSETLLNGYNWINTITFADLKNKYNIEFDTLVLDCEGAFYYILMDMPEILDNINLIIMENDYRDITHKQYIDTILLKNNFVRDYVEKGGWEPCYNNFFEVWKKINETIYI